LTDFEKYDNILEKWENPTPQPFKEQGCLQYYLLEQDACDQFSVVYEQGDKVGVYNNSQPEPALLEERPVRNFICSLFILVADFVVSFVCRDGPRLWFGGRHWELIWPLSTPKVSPCGEVKSSSRLCDSAILEFSLSIFHPAKSILFRSVL